MLYRIFTPTIDKEPFFISSKIHRQHIYKQMFVLNKKEKTSLTCFWWAGMDSNHRTHTRTDLQSAAFSHSATYPNI